MKKEKISLEKLKVSSFRTDVRRLKGGMVTHGPSCGLGCDDPPCSFPIANSEVLSECTNCFVC